MEGDEGQGEVEGDEGRVRWRGMKGRVRWRGMRAGCVLYEVEGDGEQCKTIIFSKLGGKLAQAHLPRLFYTKQNCDPNTTA